MSPAPSSIRQSEPTHAQLEISPGIRVAAEVRGFGRDRVCVFLGALHARLNLDRQVSLTLSGGRLDHPLDTRVRVATRRSVSLGYCYDLVFEEMDALRGSVLDGSLPLHGRRRHGRVDLTGTWPLLLENKLSFPLPAARLDDLSESGARVTLTGEPPLRLREGQLLKASFTIPGMDEHVSLWGTLVHHRDRQGRVIAGLWWRTPFNEAQRDMVGVLHRFLAGQARPAEAA